MICKYCGRELKDEYIFCIYCGRKVGTGAALPARSESYDTAPSTPQTAQTFSNPQPSYSPATAYNYEATSKASSDSGTKVAWVILIVSLIVLAGLLAYLFISPTASEPAVKDGVVWDAKSVAIAADKLIVSTDFEQASYRIQYDTGWVRFQKYYYMDDVVWRIEETWFGNVSGWGQQNIVWQIEELESWASPYEQYSFFSFDIVHEGDDLTAYYTVKDMNLIENSKDFRNGWLFTNSKSDGYISMEATEKKLLNDGYTKQ